MSNLKLDASTEFCKGLLHVLFITVFVLSCGISDSKAADKQHLWEAVRDGEAFAVMRHALAPGTGDPANFALNDCTTQRNLSDTGREQARRIGGWFRQNGISQALVYSSAWCRCVETAELLDFGNVAILAEINSFWRNRELAPKQTLDFKQWLLSNRSKRPQIFVTHYINILELTGETTGSGEIIVAKIGDDLKITVLGSLE